MLRDLYWKVKLALPRGSMRQLVYIVFVLFSLPVGVYLANKVVSFRSGAQDAAVKVFISPEQQNLPPDSTFKVMIDAGQYNIAFARLVITFDQSKIELTNEISTTSKLST